MKQTKELKERKLKARIDVNPKLAITLTDTISIWTDPRQYILKDDKKILGYYTDLVNLIWKLFKMDLKLSLEQETDLKTVISKIEHSEQYIRGLAEKLEGLQSYR